MKTIISGALVGCGLWMLYLSRNLIRLGLSSYRWVMTQGTIVDSHHRNTALNASAFDP